MPDETNRGRADEDIAGSIHGLLADIYRDYLQSCKDRGELPDAKQLSNVIRWLKDNAIVVTPGAMKQMEEIRRQVNEAAKGPLAMEGDRPRKVVPLHQKVDPSYFHRGPKADSSPTGLGADSSQG